MAKSLVSCFFDSRCSMFLSLSRTVYNVQLHFIEHLNSYIATSITTRIRRISQMCQFYIFDVRELEFHGNRVAVCLTKCNCVTALRTQRRTERNIQPSNCALYTTLLCRRETKVNRCAKYHQCDFLLYVYTTLRLRSASTSTLVIPSTRRTTLGDRAFPVTAAQAWNVLPSSVRSAPSLLQFRRDLKTTLFQSSISSPQCPAVTDCNF